MKQLILGLKNFALDTNHSCNDPNFCRRNGCCDEYIVNMESDHKISQCCSVYYGGLDGLKTQTHTDRENMNLVALESPDKVESGGRLDLEQ